MATEMTEMDQIFATIEAGNNFLLSGGAGSGKTYTLVKVLQGIFERNLKAKVACITFTNVAVHEINDRIDYSNMQVSTIHDFLWDNIKLYQKDIKLALIALVADETIRHSGEEVIDEAFLAEKSVDYKEWKSLKDAIVSHDEIITIAEYLFKNNPLLCKILKDKYDYILIDEYQDTFPQVINILLEYLPAADGKNILGFFGDAMQSIYNDTMVDMTKYIQSGLITEIIKKDNRRNPASIISLANKLRTDNVQQAAANDPNAPNYQKDGSITFLYSRASPDINVIKQDAHFEGWDFNNSARTKELYLTHNLIAPKAGFSTLMEIYDKDRILEFKNDLVHKIKDKAIDIAENATFGDVITLLGVQPTGVKQDFILANPELYVSAKSYPWAIFSKIYADKDQLIGDKKGTAEEEKKKGTKRDALIRHLFHIQECLYWYEKRNYNEFIKQTGFKVVSVQSKIDLKNAIETLRGMAENTIEEIIDFAEENRIWKKDDKLFDFITNKEYLYNRVKDVPYKEFLSLYNFVEGYTPFSTQHNIKGAEFDNVFVVLDNGKWNRYNFGNMLTRSGTPTVQERTLRLFYVCCTRAKENLIIFYYQPTDAVLTAARTLIGAENVIQVA